MQPGTRRAQLAVTTVIRSSTKRKSSMKPSELFEALHALITERVPLHIWGACGVGKSQIVAQVAAKRNCEFLDIRAVQLDPVDLRGLPRISADQAEWVPPRFRGMSAERIYNLIEESKQEDGSGGSSEGN